MYGIYCCSMFGIYQMWFLLWDPHPHPQSNSDSSHYDQKGSTKRAAKREGRAAKPFSSSPDSHERIPRGIPRLVAGVPGAFYCDLFLLSLWSARICCCFVRGSLFMSMKASKSEMGTKDPICMLGSSDDFLVLNDFYKRHCNIFNLWTHFWSLVKWIAPRTWCCFSFGVFLS